MPEHLRRDPMTTIVGRNPLVEAAAACYQSYGRHTIGHREDGLMFRAHRALVFVLLLGLPGAAMAQGGPPQVVLATEHDVSPPLRLTTAFSELALAM